MPSANALFAQATVLPPPVPLPRPTAGAGGATGSGGGPVIDLGPLLDALNPVNLFAGLLKVVTQQLAEALDAIWTGLWHSGINIYTYTDPNLTYRFGTVAEVLFAMRLLVAAITAAGVVLAACSLAGREVFGWGGELGDHLGRLALGAILGNGAALWIQLLIDLNNAVCEAIGRAGLPSAIGGVDMEELSSALLLIVLLWFGLKLGFKMAYRLGMLWVLIPVAPVALACWAIPQTQWVAATWTRLFVGWTFGQVLVTIALKLAFVVSPFGPAGESLPGLVFSIAMAAMACDLVDLLVRASGGPGGGTHLRLAQGVEVGRAIVSAALTRLGSKVSPQLRLPGF